MINRKLRQLLLLIPEDARVYTYTDHGQTPEKCPDGIRVSTSQEELPYYGEDLEWEEINEVRLRGEMDKITAILIG